MNRSMRQRGAINPVTFLIVALVAWALLIASGITVLVLFGRGTIPIEPPSEKATQLSVTVQDGTRSPIFVTPVTVEGNQYLLVQHKSNGQWQVTLCPRLPVAAEKPARSADGF